MVCQVCGKPAAPQAGVDGRFCSLAHQHHFEQEQSRLGLSSLLTLLQAENKASRSESYPEASPAVAAATRIVRMLDRSRQGEFPLASRMLAPVPMSRQLRWPPGGEISFPAAQFEPCLRAAHLVVEQGTSIQPSPIDLHAIAELRAPGNLDIGVSFGAVEFLGPPPKLPALVSFPMRHRYFGSLARCAEPEPVDLPAVALMEPEAQEPQTASGLADILAGMVTLLRTKGKQCK